MFNVKAAARRLWMPPGCTAAAARTPRSRWRGGRTPRQTERWRSSSGHRPAKGIVGRCARSSDRRDRCRRSGWPGRGDASSPTRRARWQAAGAMPVDRARSGRDGWCRTGFRRPLGGLSPKGAAITPALMRRSGRRPGPLAKKRFGAGAGRWPERGEVELPRCQARRRWPHRAHGRARVGGSGPSARSRAAPTTLGAVGHQGAGWVSTPRPADTPVTRSALAAEVYAVESTSSVVEVAPKGSAMVQSPIMDALSPAPAGPLFAGLIGIRGECARLNTEGSPPFSKWVFGCGREGQDENRQ